MPSYMTYSFLSGAYNYMVLLCKPCLHCKVLLLLRLEGILGDVQSIPRVYLHLGMIVDALVSHLMSVTGRRKIHECSTVSFLIIVLSILSQILVCQAFLRSYFYEWLSDNVGGSSCCGFEGILCYKFTCAITYTCCCCCCCFIILQCYLHKASFTPHAKNALSSVLNAVSWIPNLLLQDTHMYHN